MNVERATETYEFSCVRCGHRWYDDYTVLDVTGVDGETTSFYQRGGLPCRAPAAADTVCPRCDRGPVPGVRRARLLLTSTDVRVSRR